MRVFCARCQNVYGERPVPLTGDKPVQHEGEWFIRSDHEKTKECKEILQQQVAQCSDTIRRASAHMAKMHELHNDIVDQEKRQ